MDVKETKRICILVKASPQPSKEYQQTVCCAGITEEGEFLRLYPIPYTQLSQEQRFRRFDWIEATVWKAGGRDHRPESHKLDPDSIRIFRTAQQGRKSRHDIWRPHVYESFQALKDENMGNRKVSLGIIKPTPGSLTFSYNDLSKEQLAEQKAAAEMAKQQSFFSREESFTVPSPTKAFRYKFTSGENPHNMIIHDWEVQAAYYKFRKYHGHEEGEKILRNLYEMEIPTQNLHFIMGTQLSRPHQFMIIGLLRYKHEEPQQALF
ncbi:hypothetical protein [Oceanobacter sp. 4_MG-2023]|uniref:hypothetical protein n=1 Tax=Oceanobacter sp. 4_MG-2023 TaxID=3062623 RepID=UPI00273600F9|nr:hypothetical protein [Oceanobacter sp. 4_MG-2023]MDP2548491.1 hypothetical protein [Oceanobacter sp. 4_MG-2023]